MYIRTMTLVLALLSCGHLPAQDYNEIVGTATMKYDDAFLETWSFTETRTTGDGIRVASYDPSRPEEWALLLLNGDPPEEDAVSDFLEEKEQRKAERQESTDEDGLFEMITPGSLELIEESDAHWRFSFQPRDEEDAEFMAHVAGELVVIKDGHYLGEMSMRSRGPFKPRAGVKISEFEMVMRFMQATGQGPVVPESITSQVVGKAFLVATIEEDVVVEFSDYQKVNQADEVETWQE